MGCFGAEAEYPLLSNLSIRKSQAGCRLQDQLTVRQSKTFPTFVFMPFSVFQLSRLFLSDQVCGRTSAFFLSTSILPLLSSFSLRHHHSSLPSLTGLGSKTGACSWEVINQQTLSFRAQLQNQNICRLTHLMDLKHLKLLNKNGLYLYTVN